MNEQSCFLFSFSTLSHVIFFFSLLASSLLLHSLKQNTELIGTMAQISVQHEALIRGICRIYIQNKLDFSLFRYEVMTQASIQNLSLFVWLDSDVSFVSQRQLFWIVSGFSVRKSELGIRIQTVQTKHDQELRAKPEEGEISDSCQTFYFMISSGPPARVVPKDSGSQTPRNTPAFN